MNHIYRFTATDLFISNITVKDIAGALGCYGLVADTSVKSMFSHFKINSVEMWTPTPSIGSSITCSCAYNYQNQKPYELTDTSNSILRPAHILMRPPSDTLAAQWISTSDSDVNILYAVIPTGSIVDVNITAILSDEQVGPTINVSTADTTSVYYLALDGYSNVLVPVERTTTH
jgi:hypothetical protein